jgi:hypothetical protein
MNKGFVSSEMAAGRISSHKKITDLTNGFKLENGTHFTLFIVPKANVTAGVIGVPDNAGLMVDCKLYQDDDSSDFPVLFNQWTEAAIQEISADAIDLTTYDVYWGAPVNVQES